MIHRPTSELQHPVWAYLPYVSAQWIPPHITQGNTNPLKILSILRPVSSINHLNLQSKFNCIETRIELVHKLPRYEPGYEFTNTPSRNLANIVKLTFVMNAMHAVYRTLSYANNDPFLWNSSLDNDVRQCSSQSWTALFQHTIVLVRYFFKMIVLFQNLF